MTSVKHILIFTLLLLLSGDLWATHIVGGGITYECIGSAGNSRTYRFTLKVYRDCINGQAQFDDPAAIAIYSGTFQNNFLYDNFSVSLESVQSININEPDCIDNLPLLCLEEATYVWETSLPVSNQNYYVEYQRCCRTNAIANIVGPGDTGATYYVEITPQAQQLCNSSPVFDNFPPVVVCNNYPLQVDYSATDPDGDLLVYSFCAPYNGGGPVGGGGCTSPAPNPPCNPPYDEVVFISPLYSATEPMGGNPIIDINSQTGVISGTPIMNGQFVVGVCVQEFRNGVLLSVTRRDFQFNVAPCAPQVTALVDYDELAGPQSYIIRQCNGSTNLTIDNQSFNLANIQSFHWSFDLQNGNFVNNSTDFDLNITFPDFGIYHGTLELNPGLACGTTAQIQVELYEPASLELGPNIMICNDTTIVFDAGSNFASYVWQDGSTGQTFTASTSGNYQVTATDHCGNVLTDAVSVIIAPIPTLNLPDLTLCPGESSVIDVPGFSNYNWAPGAGLSCTNCQTVTVQPTASTDYTLLAVNDEGCAAADTFKVTVLPTPMATYTIQFYPNETVTLGGQVYTQSTTVVLEVPSTTGGCDSLNTYILQLIPTAIDIQCPPSMIVPLPNNATSIPVNYAQPTATTDCPGAAPTITQLQGLASGANFPGGITTVCYEAVNTCGNRDTCCFTVNVTSLDIQCPPNVTVALPNNATTIPVNYVQPTATTDCPDPATVQLQSGLVSGADFPAGVNTICYQATNTCGNQESCCFTVTVSTLSIQCPPNVTVALPNNATTIPVNYTQPTAVTNCPGSVPDVQLTQGLASGSNFPSGVNTVCYEATNTCGNQASCCFTVTVTTIDIQCPANITVPIPNNANSVAVTYAAATASTNCPGSVPTVSLVQGLASGANFPAGVSTICYQATNTCGNEKSCCFTVTATTLDITCPANIITQLPVAATTIAVNYAAPTTTSNCTDPAVVNLLQGQLSGSAFPLGVHKVCYEASNSCGNQDTCCFNITVLDAPPPCDIKQIGCAKFELLDIRLDSITQRRYRIRATNFCPTEVDYVAFQLPIGTIAVTPKEGWIYTAPNSGNDYLVRNPNASPFYSIRYRSIDPGLKNGEADVFEYRLPQQSKPAYIHSGMRLKNGEFYAAHLNTWYCPVQPWAGIRGVNEEAENRGNEVDQLLPLNEVDLSLRPNPTTGMVYVDMDQWRGQAVQLQVLNPQGQVVISQHFGAVEEWVELEMSPNLSNGLYFLVVKPEGGGQATARFVLER